ncbi:hypothetical protein [Streptomyces sp. NPDC001282]|uniref:hypothetical protein n=1 Tax=Streptomyces sp. NPDC001282 TaxID=3364557 RepID=UPI0036B7F209
MSIDQAESTSAEARSVDDFLANLDAVLADSTVVPTQVIGPVPDLGIAAVISDADLSPEAASESTAEPVLPPAEPLVQPVPNKNWWDRPPARHLYEEAEGATDPVDLPHPRIEDRIQRDRLPKWWEQKSMDVLTTAPGPEDEEKKEPVPAPQPAAEQVENTAGRPEPKKVSAEDKCLHLSLLSLRDEADQGDGEVVARLCLDCNEKLPPTDPEPTADCEHEQRLEARSESGKLIGYVCAAEGCGTRLSVEEVHGRVGKWLRPAAKYYPRPRNPFSPPEGEEAKPALSAGTLRLLANAGAAGAGYWLGLVPLIGHAIEECGRTTSIGGALTLGGGLVLFVAHVWDRKTRHWHAITAWLARIPLASAITALALYAPASQI